MTSYFTPIQVAEALQVSTKTVYRFYEATVFTGLLTLWGGGGGTHRSCA